MLHNLPPDNLSTDWFRYTSIKEHLNVLRCGPIGRSLDDFIIKNKIRLLFAEDMPPGVHGMYVKEPFSLKNPFSPGKILYGPSVNALILGHEERHAWQLFILPENLRRPRSAHDYAIYMRFIEADARAVHFGIAMEAALSMGTAHPYVSEMLGLMNGYEKRIYGENKEIPSLASNPKRLAQAMRDAFDGYLIYSIGSAYDRDIISYIDEAGKGGLLNAFMSAMPGIGEYVPCFSARERDPDYTTELAKYLGAYSSGKAETLNYLSGTKGPPLNSDFYTRLCNHRIEKAIDKLHPRV